MIYLLISNIVTAVAIILAYNLGLRNSQVVARGEPVRVLPKVKIQTKIDKEAKKEQDKLNTIISNLESYNGTPEGQVKING
jgi:hypothetical protein